MLHPFLLLHPKRMAVAGVTASEEKDRCAISKTGTGFAGAKLSEILPAARAARFVRMTKTNSRTCRFRSGAGCR
jgi:hypothetical protein